MIITINYHVIEAFSVRSEHHLTEFLAFFTIGFYKCIDMMHVLCSCINKVRDMHVIRYSLNVKHLLYGEYSWNTLRFVRIHHVTCGVHEALGHHPRIDTLNPFRCVEVNDYDIRLAVRRSKEQINHLLD